MNEALRCPQCKTDLSDTANGWVLGCIERWLAGQLISPDQADRLRGDLRSSASSQATIATRRPGLALTPSMALLLIGGLLVISAVVMVATELWDDLIPAGRFAVVAVPAALMYLSAAFLRLRRMTSDWVPAAFALVGAGMAPFAVWLALGMTKDFVPEKDMAMWVAIASGVGLAVQLATLAWLRAPALTVPPSATLIWLAGSLAEWLWPHNPSGEPVSVALVLSGVLLMVAGQAFGRYGHARHAIAPNAVGVAIAMCGLTVLAAEQKGLYDALALAAPIALIVAACKPQYRPYLWAGAAFLVVNTFRFGLSRFATTLGLPIAVMMCGLVSMIIGYVVHRVRKEYAA